MSAPRGGSRFLYDPFDAANARIEANERVLEERWEGLTFRLRHIEGMLERLERRLWLAVMGVAGTVLAQGVTYLIQL
ncbi:GTA head formation protein, RCAP_rcc01685 family [Jannaschia formosa]|uniref:GTA head formation protein, RCAP_rcc01685 family n=1 Tax=Jannaschia formosa TaxID=2259592 RepID=UPI000E1B9ADA|nr:hypothetical protein [Jannaschia formosa]TFL18600.1 hypothetical protein DR046_08980 [Jannaschia formosa]